MRVLVTILTFVFCASPALAAAQYWVEAPAQCGDTGAIEVAWGFAAPASDAAAEAAEPDCSAVSGVDDPSYNFCFEDAENPISTFPELIAEMRAEKLSAMILARVQEQQEAAIAATAAPDIQEQPSVVVRPVLPLNRECSSFDVTCEQQPRLPGALSLQSMMAPPVLPEAVDQFPAAIAAQTRGLDSSNPGLAPADGVQNVLVPPPDMA